MVAGVEDAGDVDVVHHRQGLPLGLEAGDDLAAVHARLDDLEGDLALDGLRLLGHEDDAHAAFADLLQELVGADHACRGVRSSGWNRGWIRARGWRFEKPPGPVVGLEQHFDPLLELSVPAAGLLQAGQPFGRLRARQHFEEDFLFVHRTAPRIADPQITRLGQCASTHSCEIGTKSAHRRLVGFHRESPPIGTT